MRGRLNLTAQSFMCLLYPAAHSCLLSIEKLVTRSIAGSLDLRHRIPHKISTHTINTVVHIPPFCVHHTTRIRDHKTKHRDAPRAWCHADFRKEHNRITVTQIVTKTTFPESNGPKTAAMPTILLPILPVFCASTWTTSAAHQAVASMVARQTATTNTSTMPFGARTVVHSALSNVASCVTVHDCCMLRIAV